jgi:hypothetical protein
LAQRIAVVGAISNRRPAARADMPAATARANRTRRSVL